MCEKNETNSTIPMPEMFQMRKEAVLRQSNALHQLCNHSMMADWIKLSVIGLCAQARVEAIYGWKMKKAVLHLNTRIIRFQYLAALSLYTFDIYRINIMSTDSNKRRKTYYY